MAGYSENIRKYRQEKNLTQKELAVLAEIHFNTVGRAERGEDIGINQLEAIAEALGVPLTWLVA